MKKQLHVGVSPLTGTIFCGHLIENNTLWGANKTDVTTEAIQSVASSILMQGGEKILHNQDGKPIVKIIIEKL